MHTGIIAAVGYTAGAALMVDGLRRDSTAEFAAGAGAILITTAAVIYRVATAKVPLELASGEVVMLSKRTWTLDFPGALPKRFEDLTEFPVLHTLILRDCSELSALPTDALLMHPTLSTVGVGKNTNLPVPKFQRLVDHLEQNYLSSFERMPLNPSFIGRAKPEDYRAIWIVEP
ncbi:MAG: hypothetical protein AB7F31_04445 [Parachlamydiales bacterium]